MGLKLLKNWDLKKTIISPVLVNLISACLVFLAVILFKEPIYRLIKPPTKVEQFPLYIIAEPYNNEDGFVVSDLFIINLRGKSYIEKDLEAILKRAATEEEVGVKIQPYIRIVSKWPPGQIINIREEIDFNKGKGRIEIIKPEKKNGEWQIRVKEIFPKAILKLIITTDYKIRLSRGAKGTLPFKYEYPGE